MWVAFLVVQLLGIPGVLRGVAGLSATGSQACDSADDEVCYLPGYDGRLHVRFRAGYINVQRSRGRYLFYTLIDAEDTRPHRGLNNSSRDVGHAADASLLTQQQQQQQHDTPGGGQPLRHTPSKQQQQRRRVRSTDRSPPVILWLSGGPGCSGMDAMVYEHGPFTFRMEGGEHGSEPHVVLEPNPLSWTKLATVIYVDSPVGTGFSFSFSPGDYFSNDAYTVADLVRFVRGLWYRYPELDGRRLFVAGESYGGVFGPRLTAALLDMLDPSADQQALHAQYDADTEMEHATLPLTAAGAGAGGSASQDAAVASGPWIPNIDLRGYLVGNAVTDDAIDGNAHFRYAYDMGFLGPDTWEKLLDACEDGATFWNASEGSACFRALVAAKQPLRNLNKYSILDPCYREPYQKQARASGSSVFSLNGRAQDGGLPAGAEDVVDPEELLYWPHAVALRSGQRRSGLLKHAVPCGDRRIAMKWLNSPKVRAALHVDPVRTFSDITTQAHGATDLQAAHAASRSAESLPRRLADTAAHSAVIAAFSASSATKGAANGDTAQLVRLRAHRHRARRVAGAAARVGTIIADYSPVDRWESCSDVLQYEDAPVALTGLHAKLLERGVRGMIYSGDHDMVVPHTGSRQWVWRLGLQQDAPLLPWVMDGQIAGFRTTFDNGRLTYATVKGAGHMVPTTHPRAALALVRYFLEQDAHAAGDDYDYEYAKERR